jgi:cytosine/adenosine deaminase-related metal-dependent hydrolase
VPFHSVLAHCIHLAAEERARIASHVANAVQNPRSNLGNRVGYPVALQRLSHVALGTDGYIADMDKEVRCAQQQGALHGEPPELALRRLKRSQYMGLGLMDQPGTEQLWLRKPADLAAMTASGARHVLVDGRVVVRDGQLPGVDVARLRQRARDAAQKLNLRMAKI